MEEPDQDQRPTWDDSSTTARTLHKALIAHGSVTRLAAALDVSVEDLIGWMRGDSIAPHEVFLRALELAFAEQKAGALYDLNDERRKRLKP